MVRRGCSRTSVREMPPNQNNTEKATGPEDSRIYGYSMAQPYCRLTHAAAGNSIRTVRPGPADDFLANLAAQLFAGVDVAAEVDAGPEAG